MQNNYKRFLIMLGVNYLIMFAITYAMVDSIEHIFLNLNRAYMAALMVAPMAISMLTFMGSMYRNTAVNIAIYGASAVIIVLIFSFMRAQTFIDNEQFLRSMITHHSSAIVMCEESDITDSEIQELCEEIVEVQKTEISQMRNILDRLE